MLLATGKVEVLACHLTAKEAVEHIERGGVDLAVFDIEMPELTGVNAVLSITTQPKPLILFATAHAEYALDAFDVDAIDYLLKPLHQERVNKAIEKAVHLNGLIRSDIGYLTNEDEISRLSNRSDVVRINDAGRHYIIPYDDIIWIEAAGDYSLIHKTDGQIVVRRTLTSLEAELSPTSFQRVHRSSIVSNHHVTEVRWLPKGDSEIIVSGGTVIKASRRHKKAVEAILGKTS